MKKGILIRLLMLMLLHSNITTANTYPVCFNGKDNISSSPASINTFYLPFEFIDRLIVIEARIDNISGQFIVDTGAEQLLLNARHFPLYYGIEVGAIGNTGKVENSSSLIIDALQIDQLRISNLEANILDLSHIEKVKKASIAGIIGYNVFKDFELFIDYPNSLIVLNRVSKKGIEYQTLMLPEMPEDSIDFELANHMIVLKGSVNNVGMRFILDSGAEINLIDRRAHKKVPEQFTVINRVNMIGVNQNNAEVIAGTLSNVKCGNQSCTKMRTLITSLCEMNAMLGTSVQGVLGYEFLYNRRVLINYRNKKIYFYPTDKQDVSSIP